MAFHTCYRIVKDSASQLEYCLDCGAPQGADAKSRYNKYGNKPTEYGGHTYASMLEADYARQLDLRQRAGHIVSWERQVSIPLLVNEKLVTVYRIDFKVIHSDKCIELVETKGKETAEWKIKRNLLEAVYADDLKSGKLKYTIER